METIQLSVLDLPPENVLEILPRFKIGTKTDDAIAQFEKLITEIRLDQFPEELAGNGKSDRHTQAAIPITIQGSPKTAIDDHISGIFDNLENIPEITIKPRRHGSIETYLAKGRNNKWYEYQRYVYLDAKKVYRHHHIPQSKTEAIAAMWTGGASAKEICVAIGKKYLGKDSAKSIA